MKKLGYIPYKEVSVDWIEMEGSKLNFFGMAKMGIDLVFVRLFYTFGFWKIRKSPNLKSLFNDTL